MAISLQKHLAIVENSGYVGECTIAHCSSWADAYKYIDSHYDPEEKESLHVAIAVVLEDGSHSYDY
jgi:hypothetical protein